MEAVFLIQPWVQARTAMDCCKLCYQERDNKSHLECKRAHLSAYNSLLAIVKLEKDAKFEEASKKLEEAKQTCLSTAKPDGNCHGKSQEALKQTLQMYEKVLEDYKKHLPSRTTPPRL
jgi:hypothetical protein